MIVAALLWIGSLILSWLKPLSAVRCLVGVNIVRVLYLEMLFVVCLVGVSSVCLFCYAIKMARWHLESYDVSFIFILYKVLIILIYYVECIYIYSKVKND